MKNESVLSKKTLKPFRIILCMENSTPIVPTELKSDGEQNLSPESNFQISKGRFERVGSPL
jgi:hypothetical protein